MYEDAANIGVKIESFDLGNGNYCEGKFIYDEWDVAGNILREHGGDCETYKDAYEFLYELAIVEDKYRDEQVKLSQFKMILSAETGQLISDMNEFDPNEECLELLANFRQMIFENYRIVLREEYDYLTSEEAIREMIDANDYEFTEDGRIY